MFHQNRIFIIFMIWKNYQQKMKYCITKYNIFFSRFCWHHFFDIIATTDHLCYHHHRSCQHYCLPIVKQMTKIRILRKEYNVRAFQNCSIIATDCSIIATALSTQNKVLTSKDLPVEKRKQR